MVTAEQRIASVTYNGDVLMSGYASYFYDAHYDLGISIDGIEGPYRLAIRPRLGDEEGVAGIGLTFMGANGQTREVLLPKDAYVSRILKRIELTDGYNHLVLRGTEDEQEKQDTLKSIHHDQSANRLEELLAAHGIRMEGARKPEAVEGETICASESARHIFGAVTGEMTELLRRINPELGKGRSPDSAS